MANLGKVNVRRLAREAVSTLASAAGVRRASLLGGVAGWADFDKRLVSPFLLQQIQTFETRTV